jgi:hypothetical protein
MLNNQTEQKRVKIEPYEAAFLSLILSTPVEERQSLLAKYENKIWTENFKLVLKNYGY